MKNVYWNKNGKFQTVAMQLEAMIPMEGAVKNPKKNRQLEHFRKAVNCYYDLYNNGLMNRAQSFAKVFGISSGEYKLFSNGRSEFADCLYEDTEKAMNSIVYAAAVEQGLMVVKGING